MKTVHLTNICYRCACVRTDILITYWFNVSCGFKQRYILSSFSYNVVLDNLVKYMNSLYLGMRINDVKVCVILYTDDIVLIAGNGHD